MVITMYGVVLSYDQEEMVPKHWETESTRFSQDHDLH
jgi:hypothetical protein